MNLKHALIRPLGFALRGKRAGKEKSYRYNPNLKSPKGFNLRSADFNDGGTIPLKCCGEGVGHNLSPQLSWSGAPKTTKQFLLIMEDYDVPFKEPLLHMVALISATTKTVKSGAFTPDNPQIKFIPGFKGHLGYAGPRPFPGHGIHHYCFHLYALDTVLDKDYSKLEDALPHIRGHILAGAHLVGVKER